MVVFLPALMGRREGAKSVFVLQLALFFLAQPMATSSTLLNQFGLDASGVRRFLLLPVPFDRALRASSAALLVLGGAVIIPALILCSIVSFPFPARLFLLQLGTALAGAFLFSAIGLWTSILFPRPMRFDTIMSNAMSPGGTLVMTAAIALALGAAFVFKDWTSLKELADYWWLSTVGLVAGAGAYSVSLRCTTKLLESRRDRLLDALKDSDFLD
jgi:hypothetical protein